MNFKEIFSLIMRKLERDFLERETGFFHVKHNPPILNSSAIKRQKWELTCFPLAHSLMHTLSVDCKCTGQVII